MRKIISGIYRIINKINGKGYTGSAVDLEDRWACHKSLLLRGKHHSKHLQRAWNKDGKDSFEFIMIEQIFDVNLLIEREQYWIDFYKSYDQKFGYNMLPKAGSRLGSKHTEETKKKMRNRVISEEQKERLRLARLGTKLSKETRKKMSGPRPDFIPWNVGLTFKIGPWSNSHRQNWEESISTREERGYVSPLKDRQRDEKTIESMKPTMFKSGRIPWNKGIEMEPMSEEQKKVIGDANRGKKKPPFSNEHIQNLKLAHLGKKASPEVKAKMSQIQKEIWRRRKEGTL